MKFRCHAFKSDTIYRDSPSQSFLSLQFTDETVPSKHSMARQGRKYHCGSPVSRSNPPRKATPWPAVQLASEKSIPVLQVNVVPEHRETDVASGTKMWIRIDLTTSIGDSQVTTPDKMRGGFEPIDAIVLIDNSYVKTSLTISSIILMSPRYSSLRSSLDLTCETVLDIAGLLKDPNDRLAVYSTNCRHKKHSAISIVGCQLHPLKKPSMRLLGEELQRITIPFDGRPATEPDLLETLKYALEGLKEGSRHSDTIHSSRCRVFVISHRPSIDLNTGSSSLGMPIHLISAALFQPRAQLPSGSWMIHSSLVVPDADLSEPPAGCLHAKLTSAMAVIRSAGSLAPITEVEVALHAGRGCAITRVIGTLRYESLAPGHSTSMFAEVEVPMWTPSHRASNSSRLQKSKTHTKEAKSRSGSTTEGPVQALNKAMKVATLDGTLEDLELLLGEISQDLLHVNVQYRHRFIPSNHALLVRSDCRIRRSNSSSVWGGGATDSEAQLTARRTEFLNGLISTLASLESVDQALEVLDSTLDSQTMPKTSVEYLSLVKEELSCVKASAERSPRSTPSSSHNRFGHYWDASPSLGRFSFEDRSPLVLQPLQDTSALRNSSAADSPKTVIHSTKKHRDTSPTAPSSLDGDEARQIWRNIRRNSKTLKQLETTQTDQVSEEAKALKDVAVMNKRSVGADTLRSLAMSGGSMTGEDNLVGPWL